MSKTRTKTSPKMTVDEAFENLTGPDEDAIERHYGASIYDWPDDKSPVSYARALALPFLARSEPGYPADDAYAAAYPKAHGLSAGAARAFFAEDADLTAELESGEDDTPDA